MTTDALQQASLYRGLDPGAAQKLVALAKEVSFMKGAELVRQNEPARGAYLIRKGEVEARVALPGGGALTVASLRDGDVFGEMALIERGVCSATVRARSNVDGWFIPRDDFRAMVASRDPAALAIQRAITKNLATKLRALNTRVRSHPAPEDRPARDAPPEGDPLAGVARAKRASFDWRAFLPALPFFEGFDADAIDQLVAEASVLELPRGAWVFAQNQAATASYLVVRGALEVFTRARTRERRVAIAGPGELVGYLAALEAAKHAASCRVRESACLLELPRAPFLAHYEGSSTASVSLQRAIHRSLLQSLARTNTLLTRLISHARLTEAAGKAKELESELYGQMWRATRLP